MNIRTTRLRQEGEEGKTSLLFIFDRRHGSKEGMTIIEILIVIALIGTITTLIMTNVLNKNDEAKIDLTTVQEKKIGENLDFYKLHVGRYPTTEDGLRALLQAPSEAGTWRGPYIEADKLEDSWGREFKYENLGPTHYQIISAGPDGELGSADDISFPDVKDTVGKVQSFELNIGKIPEEEGKASATEEAVP